MKNLILSFIGISISIIGYSQFEPDGPDAPDVNLQSVNNEFNIQLSNPSNSNNYYEAYNEYGDNIDPNAPDQLWRFQGYIVYQVINSSVSLEETTDTNVIRIVAIVDKLDTVGTLQYTSYDSVIGCENHTLNAPNLGIPNMITISENAFTGQAFTEGESYCFRVYAYASNPYNIHPDCTTSDQILLSRLSAQSTPINTFCAVSTQIAGLIDNKKLSLSFYPNPVTNILTINNNSYEPIEVFITDTEGRQIAEFNISETKTFDFSSYAPGYYFLHTKSEDIRETHKIILMH